MGCSSSKYRQEIDKIDNKQKSFEILLLKLVEDQKTSDKRLEDLEKIISRNSF